MPLGIGKSPISWGGGVTSAGIARDASAGLVALRSEYVASRLNWVVDSQKSVRADFAFFPARSPYFPFLASTASSGDVVRQPCTSTNPVCFSRTSYSLNVRSLPSVQVSMFRLCI